jgi:long-chain acyl-CoA synthetase
MLTHRNIVANLEQTSSIFESMMIPGKEWVVTAIPLYHIFSLQSHGLSFLKCGCANLLITDR